jgi:small-conductance mechanosensitive channel
LKYVYFVFCSALLATVAVSNSVAQLPVVAPPENSVFDGDPVQMVQEIANRVETRRDRQKELLAIRKEQGALSNGDADELAELEVEIEQLQQSLVLSITGQSTLATLYDEPDEKTTWQEDIVDVIKPLADSLKSVTRRPRQIAELRSQLLVIDQKQSALQDALGKFGIFDQADLQGSAAVYVADLREGWTEDLQQLEGEELIANRQLQELLGDKEGTFSGILPSLKRFVLGTGLTLLLAVVVSVAMYFFMRSVWWFIEKKIVSKETRRKSTVYRFASYMYHLLTAIIVILSIFIVLYVREDLLLLALASLLLAGLLLNIKQFLPRYFSEARLLLNLGSVREEERVIYNGLPWQVKSLNLHTVLHNPALDGIVRLPLGVVRELVSRPVRNNLWFPSQRGDYIILPDGLLGQVKYQTPDLVEVTVKGGMAQTFTTPDFYGLNIINLSRDKTFGVSVTFGLDYSLQSIAVKEIPEALHSAITEKLKNSDLAKELVSLLVELSEANASSLDFIIFGSFQNSCASSYYRIERLFLQTCVEVSNERDWTIPFPQLTVHNG